MRIFNDPQLMLTLIGFQSLVAYLIVAAVLLVWRPKTWLTLLTVFFGLLAGFIDLRVQDPQLPALLLLAGGFFAASIRPRRAWLWPWLLAPWIPLAALWKAVALGLPPASVLAGLLGFIPALFGCAAGALTAWSRVRMGFDNSPASI